MIVPLVESYFFNYAPYISDAIEIARNEYNRELSIDHFPIEGTL